MKRMQEKQQRPDARDPRFLIGKDSRGHWVVQDERGLCGGLFVNRNEALHFAMFENSKRAQAVIMVPGILELNMNGGAASTEQAFPAPARRRVRA